MNQFIIKLRTILLRNKLYYAIFLLFLMYCVCFTTLIKNNSIYLGNETDFTGTINNYKIDGNKLTFELNGVEKLIGNYYFETEAELIQFKDKYELGDNIKLLGELLVPKNNTIPNTFNYKEYLYNKKIFYTLKIETFELLKRNKNIFYKIKNFVYKKIDKIENNEFIYALVLGESLYIDADNYRINGVSHLFALSGSHVTILSFILFKIINFMIRIIKIKNNSSSSTKEESSLISYIIVFILLLLFSFITGFKPALLNSVIFFMLSGINKVYYFHIKNENLLILTFCIIALINPFCIYDLGFKLSIVITYFLLISINMYKNKQYFKSLIYSSFISLMSAIPILINNFFEINLLSIMNNLFFVPFISFIVFPLSLITFIFPFLNKTLFFTTQISDSVSTFLSKINIFSIFISKMTSLEIIIYYVFFILLIKSKKKVLCLLSVIILLSIVYYKPLLNKDTNLYFIDVSQGDSALITNNKISIMIDTGGIMNYRKEVWEKRKNNFNLMKSNIIPFMKSIGIKELDYLFLTHGDEDHAGYAKYLTENLNVNNVIINTGDKNNIESNIVSKKVDKYYNIDGIKIYSLNNDYNKDENRNSLILLIIINNKKILMMGDASKKEEINIIKKYNLNNIFILKVGHHGSNTSTHKSFIGVVNPKYSIISVGENNRFNHPNPTVLETLSKSNTIIYRTDELGTIYFKFNKNNVNIFNYLPY